MFWCYMILSCQIGWIVFRRAWNALMHGVLNLVSRKRIFAFGFRLIFCFLLPSLFLYLLACSSIHLVLFRKTWLVSCFS